MRAILILLLSAVALAQQPEPVPGNPDHVKPEEGWFCHTNSPIAPAPDGHACECAAHRTCHTDPNTGERVVVEHLTCRVWCFKDHCRCAAPKCDS